MRGSVGAIAAFSLCSAVQASAAIAPGARYVAMGSSFAAGPGIGRPADAEPGSCARSSDNYAHQLARARGFDLVDVTCSGATTRTVLGPDDGIPAQIDAVDARTALVTITIGGNDVELIGGLSAASCRTPAGRRARASCAQATPVPPAADEAAWRRLTVNYTRIIDAVRRRAPDARIVLVDYFTIMPAGAPCARIPVSPQAAGIARTTEARLAAFTARMARGGVALVRLSALSRDHHACARVPWLTGWTDARGQAERVPYHPNAAGMTAAAQAIARVL